ncbi:Kelch repeat type 1 [Corchorus olitorius]|uniref:Kelch repeat type 1 n=1 Tax=Corchorus olitorius TaxID=93759 RepID=A0A1R3JLL1_9ROSI|nr:Kelch repeat type 1 [Corchorus olitorius]
MEMVAAQVVATDGVNCHAAEVFCVEVNGQPNNNEWKRCRPMNIGRKNPLACAVDGKIYVFGGARDDGPFIGEVYDPVEDIWDYLPPLDLADFVGFSPISPMNVVLDDPNDATNKLILVHFKGTVPLYAYNVRKENWVCFDEEFGRSNNSPLNDVMWPLMLWWIILSTFTLGLVREFWHTI